MIFKAKHPSRYIQVKTCLSQGNIIVICSDVTRLKQSEKDGKRLRSQFFSSVAHELRTPLNSIIPILRLVLESAARGTTIEVTKILDFLKIVLNSSIHL
jgi:signal transduction histidine kinase